MSSLRIASFLLILIVLPSMVQAVYYILMPSQSNMQSSYGCGGGGGNSNPFGSLLGLSSCGQSGNQIGSPFGGMGGGGGGCGGINSGCGGGGFMGGGSPSPFIMPSPFSSSNFGGGGGCGGGGGGGCGGGGFGGAGFGGGINGCGGGSSCGGGFGGTGGGGYRILGKRSIKTSDNRLANDELAESKV